MTNTPQVTDHGGGVWSIPVPIPDNPLGHTLVHVLDTDAGPVLIDTGWDDPGSWDTLAAGLTACGTSPAEITGVLVTHHHPDHHGLSARVRETSGAWIAMHPADSEVVRRTREVQPAQWLDHLTGKLTAAGAPEEHLAPLRAARSGGRAQPLPGSRAALPDRDIVPGELLPGLPGRRLRAVWTPGHTPGHVCLHLEERHPASATVTDALEDGRGGFGRLFSGDHLLPGITPHIGLYEDPEDDPGPHQGAPPPTSGRGDPLGDYLASLERIAALRPAEVLPAHQYAFADATGRVAELLEHHAARLAALRALLTGRPRTLWETARAMEWNRPWEQIPASSRTIALSEAEAHLRRLVKLGQAEAVPDTDPVRYQAT
ncbi:MBL fold metallo-hydrolase [Streptomyces sp. HNM0574]|uniref:MBL fold metallo-hydrolase n=1 Tax=Streptomyces sp. HNM0574 TaxID=2714954 RepID=UPI00146AF8D6|nr:MBL fold metallo-hydrolase [Streptomyces sp. HNM0574]NLU70114.1 MBL fold metallo-hydrolase [Streptomyces sp. HNM0574]